MTPNVPRAAEQWGMFLLAILLLVFMVAFALDDRGSEAFACFCGVVYLQCRLWLTKGLFR